MDQLQLHANFVQLDVLLVLVYYHVLLVYLSIHTSVIREITSLMFCIMPSLTELHFDETNKVDTIYPDPFAGMQENFQNTFIKINYDLEH